MTYLLLICAPENVQLTPEESAAMGPATDAWLAEMEGVRLTVPQSVHTKPDPARLEARYEEFRAAG